MKTFTFNVNKKTNTSSNNSNNNSAYIDNLVLSNLKKTVPYLFTSNGTIDVDYIGNDFVPNKKKVKIDITVKKPKKTIVVKDTYTDFIKAVKYLAGHSSECDTYDFMMIDGTPVKIFSDEIQIGYDLIPLNDFTLDMYNKLSAESKKSVVDIYIKIKK